MILRALSPEKMETKIKLRNNLWRARKRAGLERKQVAFFLRPKTARDIADYENGRKLPNLETALKFEVIYRMPIRLLFQELYSQSHEGVLERTKKDNQLFPRWFPSHPEKLSHEEFCFYAELMKGRVPSSLELDEVRNHVVSLINVRNDFLSDDRPFEEGRQ